MQRTVTEENNDEDMATSSSSVDLDNYPDVLNDLGVDLNAQAGYHTPTFPHELDISTSPTRVEDIGVQSSVFSWDWNTLYPFPEGNEERLNRLILQQIQAQGTYNYASPGPDLVRLEHHSVNNVSPGAGAEEAGMTETGYRHLGTELGNFARLALDLDKQLHAGTEAAPDAVSTQSTTESQSNFDGHSEGFGTVTTGEGTRTSFTGPSQYRNCSGSTGTPKLYQTFYPGSGRPWVCEFPGCGKEDKSFCTQSELSKHQLNHVDPDKRPYKCEHCEKRFVYPKDRRRHHQTHTDERPFECWKCNDRFTRNDHLLRHHRESCTKASPTTPKKERRTRRQSNSSATSSITRPSTLSPIVDGMDIDSSLDYFPSTPPSPTPGAY